MIELWAIVAILSAFACAAGVIAQKFAVKGDLGSMTYLMFIGLMNIIYAGVLFLFVDIFTFPVFLLFVAVLAGALDAVQYLFYVHAIKHEEITRVSPLTSLTPLFVAIFAAVLIHETFSPFIYLIIVLMFIGSFLLSFRFEAGLPKKIPVLESILFSCIISSIAIILAKYAFMNGLELIPYILCGFVGFFLASIPLWFVKKARYNFKMNCKTWKNVKFILIAEFFGMTILILTLYATTMGPVSLITSIKFSYIFIVFIFTIIASKFAPKLIKEEFEGSTFWLKLIATIILIAGTIILSTF